MDGYIHCYLSNLVSTHSVSMDEDIFKDKPDLKGKNKYVLYLILLTVQAIIEAHVQMYNEMPVT